MTDKAKAISTGPDAALCCAVGTHTADQQYSVLQLGLGVQDVCQPWPWHSYGRLNYSAWTCYTDIESQGADRPHRDTTDLLKSPMEHKQIIQTNIYQANLQA